MRRGERESWRVVSGLPAGTVLACEDTAPFPHRGWDAGIVLCQLRGSVL